ncbi:MAG: tRNA 5-methylaminomethyl-2-thiouridine biosynthesis bifunctional protein, partial [Glaciecola sp.]
MSENCFLKISTANIFFNENGTPVAADFDDVYFCNQGGIEETQYVFIQGNRLNERWINSAHPNFSIGETGFGTGLNFLVTAREFITFRERN